MPRARSMRHELGELAGRPSTEGRASALARAASNTAVALLVAHQDDDRAELRAARRPCQRPAALVRIRLGARSVSRLVDRHVGGADPPARCAGADLADHRLARPAAEVAERLLDRDALGHASAAIRPMPRSVSSGRSPAVPMIAVTGARARRRHRPAIALGDVEHGRDPGLVVGEVDDHDPRRRAGRG